MKTQRAFILPMLLVTLVAYRPELRAQAPAMAPAASPGTQGNLAPSAPGQVPLGVPTTLGRPTSEGGISGPAYAPPGMGFVPPAGYGPPGPGMPGMYPPPPSFPGAAPSAVAMANYEGPAYGGPTEMAGCPNCGGSGCPYCAGDPQGISSHMEHGFDLLGCLLPYPGGGWASPRWFDLRAEYIYWKRENAGAYVPFASDGPAGLGDPLIVLSSNDLQYGEESGFRLEAALQIGASGSAEFSYFGTLFYSAAAAVTSEFDELYSPFSDWGNNPPPQVGPPITRGGFTDTDAAEYVGISSSSELNNFEFNYRHRWMAPNGRIQGSWLAGARFLHLKEKLDYQTVVDYPDPNGVLLPNVTGFMNYNTGTENSLTGFQLGGDLWATMYPGIQVGAELKGGIFGNHASQLSVIGAESLAGTLLYESAKINDAAFVGEVGFMGTWRFTQHLTARGGYQMVYIDGVALAVNNFNSGAPFVVGDRVVGINSEGNVFLHGLTAGLEWMW